MVTARKVRQSASSMVPPSIPTTHCGFEKHPPPKQLPMPCLPHLTNVFCLFLCFWIYENEHDIPADVFCICILTQRLAAELAINKGNTGETLDRHLCKQLDKLSGVCGFISIFAENYKLFVCWYNSISTSEARYL